MTFYTPIATDADADAATFNTPLGQLNTALLGLQDGSITLTQISLLADTTLTIASGVITVTQTRHLVDTQGSAATDNLDTINGFVEGDWLMLQCVSGSRVVVVKHNTGNIYTADKADISLDDPRKVLFLLYDGVKWSEVSAGDWALKLNIGTVEAVSIGSDTIRFNKTRLRIDTRGNRTADDLDTIIGGREGDVLVLNSTSSERVITVKHGAGNIKTRTGRDVVLDNPKRTITLIFDAIWWVEVTTDGLVAKDVLDSTYEPARSIIFPQNTLRAIDGETDAYEALVLPAPEARDFVRIMASTSNNYFMADGLELVNDWDTIVTANGDNGLFWRIKTAATTNDVAYVSSGDQDLIRGGWDPVFVAVVKLDGAITDRLIWVGLFDDYPGYDSEPDTLNLIGFRFKTTFSANWMGICADGGSLAEVDTGVAVDGTTKYVLKFWVDSGSTTVYFSVNNSTPVSLNTSVPASSAELGLVASIATMVNTAKGLGVHQLYCEYE